MTITPQEIADASRKNAQATLDEFTAHHMPADVPAELIVAWKALLPLLTAVMADAFEEGVLWTLKRKP